MKLTGSLTATFVKKSDFLDFRHVETDPKTDFMIDAMTDLMTNPMTDLETTHISDTTTSHMTDHNLHHG